MPRLLHSDTSRFWSPSLGQVWDIETIYLEVSRAASRSPELVETDILRLPNIDMGVIILLKSGNSAPQKKNTFRPYLLQMVYQHIDPSHGYCTPSR